VNDLQWLIKNQNVEALTGIIFCQTIIGVRTILKLLKVKKISAKTHLGEQPYDYRKKIIRKWSRREFSVLITTSESFGYGIHHNVPNISFVFHWECPKTIHSLYQVRIYILLIFKSSKHFQFYFILFLRNLD
jgi:superfamily II DNA helicase RecQ